LIAGRRRIGTWNIAAKCTHVVAVGREKGEVDKYELIAWRREKLPL
jgi:hypothetical protein